MTENFLLKKLKFLFTIIISILVNQINSINFYFEMETKTMRCLGEYLPDKTLSK
jgi:hypothetical protein